MANASAIVVLSVVHGDVGMWGQKERDEKEIPDGDAARLKFSFLPPPASFLSSLLFFHSHDYGMRR